MSEDMYEEVTTESYGQRVATSLKNIVVGFGLIIAAIVLLFWNEGRSVERYKTLEEGARVVVSADSEKIDTKLEGKLVHMVGKANTDTELNDKIFGISGNYLIIQRTAKMYQWEEETKTEKIKETGGSETTVTRYYYNKVWSTSLNDSSDFRKSRGHRNPSTMPVKSETVINEDINLGAFKLTKGLAKQIYNFTEIIPEETSNIARNFRKYSSLYSNMIYLSLGGGTPDSPEIGDMKISFSVAKPQDVSILAQQIKNSFAEYQTDAGGTVYLLYQGIQSSKAMFQAEQEINTILTWVLRLAGIVMMFIGFKMVFGIVSTVLDVLPILGNLMEFGTGLVAFILSFGISLIVISIAWLFYRPMISAIIFAMIIGGIFWLKSRNNKDTTANSST